MHPWCRSTTIIGMDDKVQKGLQRRARNTETGKTILFQVIRLTKIGLWNKRKNMVLIN